MLCRERERDRERKDRHQALRRTERARVPTQKLRTPTTKKGQSADERKVPKRHLKHRYMLEAPPPGRLMMASIPMSTLGSLCPWPRYGEAPED